MKPMKSKLIGLGFAGGALLLVLVGMWLLAVTTPFSPGDVLYGVQYAAEQAQIGLVFNPAEKARMSFAQVENRLADIILAKDARHLDAGLIALDKCLTDAIRRIEKVSEGDRDLLYADAKLLLVRADLVLESLDQKADSQALALLEDKVDVLQGATTPIELQQLVVEQEQPAVAMSQVISFLGKDVNHGEFVLTGGHSGLDCDSCHATGVYAGTSVECEECHTLTNEIASLGETFRAEYYIYGNEALISHYAGKCSGCHEIASWEPYQFLHQEHLLECVSCHYEDAPLDADVAQVMITSNMIANLVPQLEDKTFKGEQKHWPGDCILCHQDATDWDEVKFDHESEEAENCATCHAFDGHEEEYPGACTTCHNDAEDWLNVKVDHTDYKDCYACHEDDRSEDHFRGQCSNCHSDEFWKQAFFDHTRDMDCKTCHVPPTAHYGGKCITCHSMKSWNDNVLDHTLRFCVSCHGAPENHYAGQCSGCHGTGNWDSDAVNHTGLADCQDCHGDDLMDTHYAGQCSNCHVTEDWLNIDFSHTDLVTCAECHADIAPENHYPQSCQTCHVTTSWKLIRVDHTYLYDCVTCHVTPIRHWPGDCVLCHTTTNWAHIIYEHAENDNCLDCHNQPEDHWPGQCSKCHVTTTWSLVNFDHTGYTQCNACHQAPDIHPRGQCSKCHTTDSWLVITATPTDDPTVTVGSDLTGVIVTTPVPETTPVPIFSTLP